MIPRRGEGLSRNQQHLEVTYMNCLCNFFDDNNVLWIIIIALLILSCCGNNGCGCSRC